MAWVTHLYQGLELYVGVSRCVSVSSDSTSTLRCSRSVSLKHYAQTIYIELLTTETTRTDNECHLVKGIRLSAWYLSKDLRAFGEPNHKCVQFVSLALRFPIHSVVPCMCSMSPVKIVCTLRLHVVCALFFPKRSRIHKYQKSICLARRPRTKCQF